ncbi:unannotated protein [freshwater metagenome]|uniref:Unannotated protein n=1 Tax=freshwater metagenome TaxID=449393 RepID=A0A6J7KXU7_9ZZZZ
MTMSTKNHSVRSLIVSPEPTAGGFAGYFVSGTSTIARKPRPQIAATVPRARRELLRP